MKVRSITMVLNGVKPAVHGVVASLIIGCASLVADDDIDLYIQGCVRKEINQQMERRARRSLRRIESMKGKMQSSVSREVKKQVKEYSLQKNAEDAYKSRYLPGKEHYFVPAWPHYARQFYKPDLFEVEFSFDTASQAYSSSGHSHDISQLVINNPCATLKDILLVSKLAQAGKFESSSPMNTVDALRKNHYLSFLADEPIKFDASRDFYGGSFHLARHYREGDIACGCRIPVAVRHVSFNVIGDISDENKLKIRNLDNGKDVDGKDWKNLSGSETQLLRKNNLQTTGHFHFYRTYASYPEFISTILAAKNIRPTLDETTLELGDIDLYLHCKLHSRSYEYGTVGGRIVLPTAQRPDPFILYDPALGIDGSAQIGVFTAFLWERYWFWNPYVHAMAAYTFPRRLRVRIPTIVASTLVDATPARQLVLGENMLQKVPFKELDSTVRGLTDTTSRAKINPGPECRLMFGTMIRRESWPHFFAEVFYDLWIKWKDHHTKIVNDMCKDRELFMAFDLDSNTWRMAHTIGTNLSYQWSDSYRVRAGISYVFAGRNTEKALRITLGGAVEF